MGIIYYQYVTIARGADWRGGAEEHEFIINGNEAALMMWGPITSKMPPRHRFNNPGKI
jgi:hypothetical protein